MNRPTLPPALPVRTALPSPSPREKFQLLLRMVKIFIFPNTNLNYDCFSERS